jgi:multidrug efflux pump subunit AcrA (membrane-fusion protein)
MLADTYSDFDALAAFSGEPGQFWPRFRAHAQQAFQAEGSCVLLQAPGGSVRALTQSSAQAAQRVVESGLVSGLESISDGALHEWVGDLLVMALPAGAGTRLWLVLLDVKLEKKDAASREVRMLADSYQSRRREQRTGEQVLGLSEVMDLGVSLGEISGFQDAALLVCHKLAAMLGAARVSVGWMEGGALQLKATSHGGRINTDTQEAEELVRVMEEAADQNNEVAHPGIPGSHAITRAHKGFSEKRQGAVVLSVPVRDAVSHEAQGVLLLERATEDGAWTEAELERLRLAADLVAPRLADLHRHSGWLGKRLWRDLRRRAAGLLGTEHTGWKLAVLVLLLSLVVLALIRVEHKVRAPFLLKTDAAALTAAPFAGYIDEVRYHLGDLVKKDQVLLTLDRRELLLEEANAIAGRDKNDREARAYEAQGKLAEALMAKSAQRQDEAKLAIIRHRLAMTEIRAPFDGIVVEGDLRERLSSPVQVGERLLKIVQLQDLLGHLQIDERDIGYLARGQSGELAFASRPGDKFGVNIERFEPVAEVRQEGNVFMMRVKVLGEPQDWWRPGMSGVCKLNTGKRSLLWILTHRTVETIRMWLWL